MAVVVGVVTAVFVVFALCVAFVPAWLVHAVPGGSSALGAADRLRAENEIRGTVLQGLGGLLALSGIAVGAIVTVRQVRTTREGQFIDLFTKAIEHMGSDRLTIRHGGVYAMEQIAEIAPHYRGHVAALLASFVRQQVPWPPSGQGAGSEAGEAGEYGEVPDDVAGAIAVLARRTPVLPGTGVELEKVDLRGIDLSHFDLSRFCFAGANLDDAVFTGADLTDATFTGASLRRADFTGARLTRTDVRGADVTEALGLDRSGPVTEGNR